MAWRRLCVFACVGACPCCGLKLSCRVLRPILLSLLILAIRARNVTSIVCILQTYVDRRKKEMGERNQAANHSVNVVGQLKTELVNTAKVRG